MQQSLKAIKPEGVISIIGFLGGMSRDQPSFLECLENICTVRGVLVGSRLQFEEMNECIDANGIKPVVDEKTFPLEELREAYQYMVSASLLSKRVWRSCSSATLTLGTQWEQKHFGKLVITIGSSGSSRL